MRSPLALPLALLACSACSHSGSDPSGESGGKADDPSAATAMVAVELRFDWSTGDGDEDQPLADGVRPTTARSAGM